MVLIHPVDCNHAEFCGIILFAQADGQHIFARLIHRDILEGDCALIGIQAGNVFAAVERAILNHAGAALQQRILRLERKRIPLACLADENLINAGRFRRNLHIVAEIVFKIFHTPLRERARVRLLMAERSGQILASQRRAQASCPGHLHPPPAF